MPFRNQCLAELLTPTVKDAEERQLLSPAVCAWVEGAVGLRPWVCLRFFASPCWDGAGGKLHIRAERGPPVRAQAPGPRPVPGRGEVRSWVLIG